MSTIFEWVKPQSATDIDLGDRIRDRLSGLEGTAAARIEYLTGCTQVALAQQGVDASGKPREWQYFDWQRLEVAAALNEWADVRSSESTQAANGAGDPPSGRY